MPECPKGVAPKGYRMNSNGKQAWRSLTLTQVRDILLVAIIIVVAWKLLKAEISIGLVDFRAADLLSVILAVFTIALSAAFYFKATETSNRFYDNVYKFTQENSEILGRIEAGFGERLRHLDEGYTGIRDRFERLPLDVGRARQEVDREQEELQKKEAERDGILKTLLERSQLDKVEKDQIRHQLQVKDSELRQTRELLVHLRNGLQHAEEPLLRKVESYILENILKPTDLQELANPETLRDFFARRRATLPSQFIQDMQDIGYLDSHYRLTSVGSDRMLELFRRPTRQNPYRILRERAPSSPKSRNFSSLQDDENPS